jgi:taurine dioxygenase
VLFFVDQKLSPEDHIAFARRFGSIVVNKFFPENTAHPEIAEVRKEKEQRTNIGGGWHADHSYDDEPALGSILVARELPDVGGDTMFATCSRPTTRSRRAPHARRLRRSTRTGTVRREGFYRKTDLARS